MSIATTLAGVPLVLIDLQNAIDHPDWGERNNPDAEIRIGELLAHWRHADWPIIHIRHDSVNENSHYRPGQAGHDFKSGNQPLAGETVIAKTANSAFIDGVLQAHLDRLGHRTIAVAGVITNNSVDATVRHGGNLGYEIFLLADGCFTFGQTDWNGKCWTADDVHALALSNLDGEYCRVIQTADIISSLS